MAMQLCYAGRMGTAESGEAERIALNLIRSASRFTRLAGRVPGVHYSAIAWRVLSDLESAGPTRVSELAAQQRVAQPTMTSLVNRLESEAWVERAPDPDDGRATLVGATAAGLVALHDYRRASAARIAPGITELSEGDRRSLARAAELLQQLGDSL